MNAAHLRELAEQLEAASATWMPPTLPPSTSVHDALAAGTPVWPDDWDDTEPARSPLLFPLPYNGRPAMTTALFHQLVDAACEAQRADSEVIVAAVPTARAGTRTDATGTAHAVATCYKAAGFAVTSAGSLTDLADTGDHLVNRACASSWTRRQADLTDMFVAAAADALGTEWVYRSDRIGVGKNLGRAKLCPPLCRIYDPGDPFAVPPTNAKRPPTGSDAVWASALTLGATGLATRPTDRGHIEQPVGARLGPLWKDLRSRQLCTGSDAPNGPLPLRLRITSRHRDTGVAVPIFGAPVISESTQTFVGAASMVAPLALMVDDLTPRLCYENYPATDARLAYHKLAAAHDGTTSFVTDLPRLQDQLNDALQKLTLTQVTKASAGRRGRRRGGLTGHDAIHLAVMAVCCAQHTATVAVRAANVTAVHAMAPIFEPTNLITITGDDPKVEHWHVDMPARYLTEEQPPDAP